MAQEIGFDEVEIGEPRKVSPLIVSSCIGALFVTLGFILCALGLFLSITSYEIVIEKNSGSQLFGACSLGFFGLSLAGIGFAIGLKEIASVRKVFCKRRRNGIGYHQTADGE